MYLNTGNIFQRKPSPKESMIFAPTNKVGSYRVQEGQQFFRMRPYDINECWADSPPLSLTTKQEVLHLSVTELRVEDYYLIRNKLVNPEHQQMVNRAIKENAYNEMLNRVPCQLKLSILTHPLDIEGIKFAKQMHSRRKPYTKPTQVMNIFDRSTSKQLQNSKQQTSSSNIFSTNQTPGLTQAPPSNIFSRRTSASNIYQPVANTSNSQYRPSSSNTNTQSYCSAGNVFAPNTPKDQPKNDISSSCVQSNPTNNQPNNNVTSHNNIFSNSNNIPSNNNIKQNSNNIFNNSNNTPTIHSNRNMFNNSINPIIPSSNNNLFNNSNTPIVSCGNNIFNNSNNSNQLPRNNIPYSGQNIFNKNAFQSLCNNTTHNQQNIKKQIQISIKLSENNVVYQKIITTDNNIKIHLDCSHLMQSASPRQQNPAFNSVIVTKSEQSNKNTDRTKEQRQKKVPEKNKQEIPVEREKNVTIHNFEEKEEGEDKEIKIRKCNYELRLYWLDEKKEDRCIIGSVDIGGFFAKDEDWCRKFLNQLRLQHQSVRKDAELLGLVCKIDPKGCMMITGRIVQKLINLPDYDVEYEKLTDGYAEGLKITNKHGSISWQQPVRLVELDFLQLGFAINENEVLMPKNSPLNTNCLVTFYRLPSRVEMLIEEDDYDGAFEKLTKIVEKGSRGAATLTDLSQNFWRMHVTKFS